DRSLHGYPLAVAEAAALPVALVVAGLALALLHGEGLRTEFDAVRVQAVEPARLGLHRRIRAQRAAHRGERFGMGHAEPDAEHVRAGEVVAHLRRAAQRDVPVPRRRRDARVQRGSLHLPGAVRLWVTASATGQRQYREDRAPHPCRPVSTCHRRSPVRADGSSVAPRRGTCPHGDFKEPSRKAAPAARRPIPAFSPRSRAYDPAMATGTRDPSDARLYRWRFGAVEFDEARHELRVAGLPVDIEHRPLQVLALLLRHVGEVVTKEELFDQVWAGRVTVDHVLATAVGKLRRALHASGENRIATVPRIGYRLDGPVERVAVGQRLDGAMTFEAGQPVPGREHFLLERPLDRTLGSEVWLARQPRSRQARVFKFSLDGERLSAIKREATLMRVLRDTLGDRDDFARVVDWNFESEPFFLE